MLVPEIEQSQLNRIQLDNFKRVSACLLINKPVGVTSHDVVDEVRKILRTRKVGHAGALDPFASGLLVVLVGKYTRYTEALINYDKSYLARVGLGLATSTQDPEGETVAQMAIPEDFSLNPEEISTFLQQKFSPNYEQLVPLFSSVKIDGQKLRILARKAQKIEQIEPGKYRLTLAASGSGTEELEVNLPHRNVKIMEIVCTQAERVSEFTLDSGKVAGNFAELGVKVACSKGTYIRQLAEDIGAAYGYPAFLTALERTSVGTYDLTQAISLAELAEQSRAVGLLLPADRQPA